jgi:iron complex outermembrane receptor protein
MAIEMVKRLGYDWDNYAPDWQRAIDAAKGKYSGGVTNQDDAYFLGRGLRKDTLGGIALNLALTDASSLKTTIYHHDNKGQGHWYTPYPPKGYPNPLAIRTTEYTIGRDGMVADYAWDIGAHSIAAGFWGERSLHGLTRNFYSVNGPEDMGHFLTDPYLTGFKQNFTTTTTQYYLSDTVAMMDGAMKFNFGVKAPRTHIHTDNIVAGRAAGDLTTPKKFLPQAGLNYSFTKDDEMFLSAAQNMRAYQPGVNGPFSQTQAAFNLSVVNIKPETSVSVDLGYRFKRETVQGSVSLYRADFSDRLLNVQACSGIAGCPNTFVNVGKVGTQGVETALVLTPVKNWSWFNSFTYNDSKYKSDYLDASSPVKDANGNGVTRAAGKQVVDTAKILFNTELSYENDSWFTRLGGKYTDKRYYTYLNDIEVPAFWVANLSGGYKMKSYGVFKDLSFQVNLTNLFAKKYFSTIGSNGFVNSDPTGSYATLLTGAPRQVFFSVNAKL